MSLRKRPNILFFLPDQHRYDFVSTNPDLSIRTPNIDMIARRGVAFTKAFCPSPLCAPSRACLASGKSYHHCGVINNHYDYPLDQPTYYSALKNAGYHVATVGKLDLHKGTLYWKLDGSYLLHELGFSEGIDNEGKEAAPYSGAEVPKGPYMAYLHKKELAEIHVKDFQNRQSYKDTHPTPLPEEAYCDNWVTNNGLELLKKFPKDRPWYLTVNFTGPHNPMDVTKDMWSRWDGVKFPLPNCNNQFDTQTHNRIRQNYAAMIENIDRNIGILIDEVKNRDDLDNTIIIYSSDHGEMLGDHNLWEKSIYYQPSVGIPMTISGPGMSQGLTSDALVQLYDLAATILDYAGVEPMHDVDSMSLRDVLEGRRTDHRKFIVSSLDNITWPNKNLCQPWDMIFDGRYKLVLVRNTEPILFDLLNDPLENVNISKKKKG